MIKIFKNVMDLLKVDGFNPANDDSVSVTQDQMKTIDDRLGEQAAKIADLQKSFDDQKAQLEKANADLTKAQDDLKKANETIENLKKALARNRLRCLLPTMQTTKTTSSMSARSSTNSLKISKDGKSKYYS